MSENEILELKLHELAPTTERVDILNQLSNRIVMEQSKKSYLFAEEAYQLSLQLSYKEGLAISLKNLASAQIWLSELDDALTRLKEAAVLFKELNDLNGLGNIQNESGMVHLARGEYADAIIFFHKALSIWAELKDSANEGLTMINLGSCYHETGQFESAIKILVKAQRIHHMNQNLRLESGALVNIGNVYESLGDYANALDFMFRALRLNEQIEDKRGLAVNFNNIGNLYSKLGDNVSAIEYFFKSLPLREELHDKRGSGVVLNNIGSTYTRLKNFTSALQYLEKSLKIREEIDDKFGESFSLDEIGEFYEKINDYNQAFHYYFKSSVLNEQMGNKEGMCGSRIKLGSILLLRKEFSKAIEKLKSALELSESLGAKPLIRSCHERLAESFHHLREWEKSLKHRKLELYYKRQIFGEEQMNKIRRMIIDYEVTAVNKELSGSIDDSILRKAAEERVTKLGADLKEKGTFVASSECQVVVKTFGTFEVSINAKTLTKDIWKREKARDLFKYLLLNLNKSVTAVELYAQLWPKIPESKAVSNLTSTVSILRKVLEPDLKPHKPSRFIKSKDKSYSLELGDEAKVDFMMFKQWLDLARKAIDAKEKATIYEHTAELYVGEFLEENLEDDWTHSDRELLKEGYIEAQLFLAQLMLNSQKLEVSLIHAKNILVVDPTFERAYHLIFKALKRTHQLDEVKKILAECKKAFNKQLGIAPPVSLIDAAR
jgi:tetratricopeptide (TPR) repeat protein